MNLTTETLLSLDSQTLWEVLSTRSRYPHSHEPWPDERENEHPLEIFVQCAANDKSGQLDVKLQRAICQFFENEDSNNVDDPLVEGLIVLSQHRALAGVAPSLRVWLERNRSTLETSFQDLGNEVIETMSSFASPRQQQWRDFFVELWRFCPMQWSPSIFKAVERIDLLTACRLLPELIQRARHAGTDASELIFNIWRRDNGNTLIKWLKEDSSFEREPIVALIGPKLQPSQYRELRWLKGLSIFPNVKSNGIMAKSRLRIIQMEEL